MIISTCRYKGAGYYAGTVLSVLNGDVKPFAGCILQCGLLADEARRRSIAEQLAHRMNQALTVLGKRILAYFRRYTSTFAKFRWWLWRYQQAVSCTNINGFQENAWTACWMRCRDSVGEYGDQAGAGWCSQLNRPRQTRIALPAHSDFACYQRSTTELAGMVSVKLKGKFNSIVACLAKRQ